MTENDVRTAVAPHLRLLVRWTGRLLALGFAALVLGAVAVVVVIPRAVHGQAMTVLTGSMTPTIPVGSIVLVRPVDPGTLHVGDVATYQKTAGKAVFVTHRIVGIDATKSPTRFTFKGDANRGPDVDPVTARQVRGQVWFHVPYLGAIRDGLHGKGGPTLVVTLLLAGYAISQVGAGMRERRERREGGPVEVTTNRTLVSATLDLADLRARRGLSPADLVSSWAAVVVHQDETSCTLLIAPPEGGLAACLELLEGLQVRDVVLLDAPGTLTGHGRRSTPPVREPERVQA